MSAAALLDRPAGEVATVVDENWSLLTGPVMPASTLFDLLGLRMPRGAGLQPVTAGVGKRVREGGGAATVASAEAPATIAAAEPAWAPPRRGSMPRCTARAGRCSPS